MVNEDLETLTHFTSNDHPTISIYLDLSTPQRKKDPYPYFLCALSQILAGGTESKRELEEALKEDIELVNLYLRTNGSRQSEGVAIFSCAGEYFWRAYRLPIPIPDQVYIGSTFNLQPLHELLKHKGVLLRQVAVG